MNEKKELPVDVVAQFEQIEQALSNSAVLCGTYYTSLLKNGVPPDLAYQIVLDWHNNFWLKIIQGGK